MKRLAPLLPLLLAACATSANPVAGLNTADPKWNSAECVQARQQAANYQTSEGVRDATAVAGIVGGVPVAGALAALTIEAATRKARKTMNAKVQAACVTAK